MPIYVDQVELVKILDLEPDISTADTLFVPCEDSADPGQTPMRISVTTLLSDLYRAGAQRLSGGETPNTVAFTSPLSTANWNEALTFDEGLITYTITRYDHGFDILVDVDCNMRYTCTKHI
jgi:hypothetical protein